MSVSEWSGRPDERERTFPTPQPDQGATNPPNRPQGATTSGNDGSGRLRAEVARALGNAGVSPFEIEDFKIEDVADRLHRAGLRLVSEDEATVTRIAEQTRKHALDVDRSNRAQDADYCTCGELIEEWDEHWVRAAVRALREGQ